MPSFDIVSEVDHHEVANAVDQANREVGTRFDFKGTDSTFEVEGNRIMMATESEFQLEQMLDVLRAKLAKRGVDLDALEAGEAEIGAKSARRPITLQEGIDTEIARKIVKTIKQSKLKVQASIQGDQVRVTGKKRDDLQAVMALLREAGLGLPLEFKNLRD